MDETIPDKNLLEAAKDLKMSRRFTHQQVNDPEQTSRTPRNGGH